MMDADEIQQMWGRDPTVKSRIVYERGTKITAIHAGRAITLRIHQVSGGKGVLFEEGSYNRYLDCTLDLPATESSIRDLLVRNVVSVIEING